MSCWRTAVFCCLLAAGVSISECFLVAPCPYRHSPTSRTSPAFRSAVPTTSQNRCASRLNAIPSSDFSVDGTVEYFDYEGWRCAFRRKAAAKGKEGDPPLLLVHPLGVGLGSWFWNNFLDAWEGGEVFVVDLIGLGKSDRWDPNERGMSIPLDWVRQLETLWKLHIQRPCVVFSQGGISPVVIRLAARQNDLWDGHQAVCGIVMGSPQTWETLTKGISDDEITSSFNFLSSPVGAVLYEVFKQPFFIEFFSNTFLFREQGSDKAWLSFACEAGADSSTKAPIYAYNSGMALGSGVAAELSLLPQAVLVLHGEEDRRARREPFEGSMRRCSVTTLRGNKILPWESSQAVAAAVTDFVKAVQS